MRKHRIQENEKGKLFELDGERHEELTSFTLRVCTSKNKNYSQQIFRYKKKRNP